MIRLKSTGSLKTRNPGLRAFSGSWAMSLTMEEAEKRIDFLRSKGSSEIEKLKEKVKSQKAMIDELSSRLNAQQVCIEVICSLLNDRQETLEDCVLAACMINNFAFQRLSTYCNHSSGALLESLDSVHAHYWRRPWQETRERKHLQILPARSSMGYPIEKLRVLNDVAKAAANAALPDPIKNANAAQEDPNTPNRKDSSRMAMPARPLVVATPQQMTFGGMNLSRKRSFSEIASEMCELKG